MNRTTGVAIIASAFTGAAGLIAGLSVASTAPTTTPAACMDALDAAEQIFQVNAGMADDMTTFLGALSVNPLDWRATETFASDVEGATSRITAIDYQTPAAQCRGMEG